MRARRPDQRAAFARLYQEEGLSFNEALEVVRASSLYTVHTPVPAGHDYFDENLIGKYMTPIVQQLGISWQQFMDMGRNPGSHEKFSMSVFALNTAQETNGVSQLHGTVSQKMFQPVWKGYFPRNCMWVTSPTACISQLGHLVGKGAL